MRKKSHMGHHGEYTYEEIGKRLGLTKECVRQIEMKALRKLAHPSLKNKFQSILETMALLNREEAF